MSKKVLVGLSGGIDSSFCAQSLLDAGYDVTGVYFDFCGETNPHDAVLASERLGIKLVIKNKRAEFEERVIKPFINEYKNGRTPNPCVICNPNMKFRSLIECADELGIDYIATGHYAKINHTGKRHEICCAGDVTKDQTYFLWGLSQETIARTVFPLENTVKNEIKKKDPKKESMDICFVPENDPQKFIRSRLGDEMKKGNIVDAAGNLIGRHEGIANYTLGQRRGLGVAMQERVYVTDINKEKNEVTLAPVQYLYTNKVFVSNLNFVSETMNSINLDNLTYKSRSRMVKTPCKVEFCDGGAMISAENMKKVSIGQSVVIYENDRLIFGGIAEKNLM